MNTNSNIYTVIYTTIVVVIVAATLAFVSQKLAPMQAANEKAGTISQILTAAGFGQTEHWQEIGNAKTIEFYKDNIQEAFLVGPEAGKDYDTLDCTRAEIKSTSELKSQNKLIKDGADYSLPVYLFKNGVTVVPVYGAGLWGPVWGYIAVDKDLVSVVGAYFDHASETPGLGGKIKDDPSFRAQFAGRTIDFSCETPLQIVKGGVHEGQMNAVDAITGATMTSKGLDAAIVTWLNAYKPALLNALSAASDGTDNQAAATNVEE